MKFTQILQASPILAFVSILSLKMVKAEEQNNFDLDLQNYDNNMQDYFANHANAGEDGEDDEQKAASAGNDEEGKGDEEHASVKAH